jgi:DNA helicase-2/ATP-dependent DNA helicase PcrA
LRTGPCAADQKLLELDPRLAAYLDPEGEHRDVVLDEKTLKVLDAMIECGFSELEGYYTLRQSRFPVLHSARNEGFGV